MPIVNLAWTDYARAKIRHVTSIDDTKRGLPRFAGTDLELAEHELPEGSVLLLVEPNEPIGAGVVANDGTVLWEAQARDRRKLSRLEKYVKAQL